MALKEIDHLDEAAQAFGAKDLEARALEAGIPVDLAERMSSLGTLSIDGWQCFTLTIENKYLEGYQAEFSLNGGKVKITSIKDGQRRERTVIHDASIKYVKLENGSLTISKMPGWHSFDVYGIMADGQISINSRE